MYDDGVTPPGEKVDYIDIKEAAMRIGCDHHYVRALIAQHRVDVDHTEPINKSVSKVFVTKDSVKRYVEDHRVRTTMKIRVTEQEWHAVNRLLSSLRILPDW
jgi:hypothetical protein